MTGEEAWSYFSRVADLVSVAGAVVSWLMVKRARTLVETLESRVRIGEWTEKLRITIDALTRAEVASDPQRVREHAASARVLLKKLVKYKLLERADSKKGLESLRQVVDLDNRDELRNVRSFLAGAHEQLKEKKGSAAWHQQ